MSPPQSIQSPNAAAGSSSGRPSAQKMFSWERPRLRRGSSSSAVPNRDTSATRPKPTGRSSSMSQREQEPTSPSDSSRPPSPPPPTPQKANEPWLTDDAEGRRWQKVNRQKEVSWKDPPAPAKNEDEEEEKPFLVYNDGFLPVIGSSPSLTCLIHDARAPYFHNSGIYSPKTGTLFITSAPVRDESPSAAPSRNLSSTITKIDLYSPSEFSRDKVRTGEHMYMAMTGCAWKEGIVLCAQGTLKEPAALIYMESKRPHRHFALLTNFNETPLNSPHSCVAHGDGSLWFSDPHLNHSPCFRPKPRLPPMIYRFDPATGDLRAVCSDAAHPTSLAFGPNFKTLYVLDGIPPASSQTSTIPLASNTPMIWAYSLSGFGASKAPFLTHKRLFAFTSSPPSSVDVDSAGNVYVGCLDGVHVFDAGGVLVGRIMIQEGATGVCIGKAGVLWVSSGHKVWRVLLNPSNSGRGRA